MEKGLYHNLGKVYNLIDKNKALLYLNKVEALTTNDEEIVKDKYNIYLGFKNFQAAIDEARKIYDQDYTDLLIIKALRESGEQVSDILKKYNFNDRFSFKKLADNFEKTYIYYEILIKKHLSDNNIQEVYASYDRLLKFAFVTADSN